MGLLLAIVLIVLLFGGGYGWHRTGYYGGPYVGGGFGLLILILIILAIAGYL